MRAARCWSFLVSLSGPLLTSALQTPLVHGVRGIPDVRPNRLTSRWPSALDVRMMATGDADERVLELERIIEELDPVTDGPDAFDELMDQLTQLKKEGLAPGSSAWAAVVAEAAQRSEAFRWTSQQKAQQRGDAFVRERDRAERKAAEGLEYGSSEAILAMGKAATESTQAYRVAEMQMAAAREAANRKRAALLRALFDGGPALGASQMVGVLVPSLSTDAALDLLFNSGYDIEKGGDWAALARDPRMQKMLKTTTAALKKRGGRDVALLLRRAALLVALGQGGLARGDYERVLELEPTNPEAQKYVEMANFGANFDPYEILGVARDAESDVISVAFRRLAKQWHPDRWIQGSKAEQLEAETRFKQLNLAQGVLIDAAKRRKYDAGTASVAELMIGWWEKLTEGWGKSAGKAEKPKVSGRSVGFGRRVGSGGRLSQRRGRGWQLPGGDA